MKAVVTVMLKDGVLDPQGKAIGHALNNLGFADVGEVRAGKVIELELSHGDAARRGSRGRGDGPPAAGQHGGGGFSGEGGGMMVRGLLLAGALAVPALLAWPGTGRAELITRNALLKACAAKTGPAVNDCQGYVAGIADLAQSPPGGVKPEVCIAKVPLHLIREAVTTYIQSHPGSDGPAAPAVFDALRALYKC